MHYKNEEFGFSLTVPDDWRQTQLIPFFAATGGKVAFASPSIQSWGTLNVAVVTRGFNPRAESRDRMARVFMRVAAFMTLKWRAQISSTHKLLDGELNTAWVEMTTIRFDGTIKAVEGLVEAIRNDRAYTLQYTYTSGSANQIEEILNSFRFGGEG